MARNGDELKMKRKAYIYSLECLLDDCPDMSSNSGRKEASSFDTNFNPVAGQGRRQPS